MKLYKFKMTATVAAPDDTPSESLVSVSRVFKEEYCRRFMSEVLMDDIKIEMEPMYETTFS